MKTTTAPCPKNQPTTNARSQQVPTDRGGKLRIGSCSGLCLLLAFGLSAGFSGLADAAPVTKQFDDFDPVIDGSQWNLINGGTAASGAGFRSGGGNALHFNGNGLRDATTEAFDVSLGGDIEFWFRVGNETVDGETFWEDSDPGEGIRLQYSINGGGSFADIQYLPATTESGAATAWTFFNIPIPVAAQTVATQFRWAQTTSSGTGFDQWALDDTRVSTVPEPGSLALLALGGLLFLRRRRA